MPPWMEQGSAEGSRIYLLGFAIHAGESRYGLEKVEAEKSDAR
jgi:hypothetical protein